MPEISRLLGIVIAILYRDHAPPHFHTMYGEHEARHGQIPPTGASAYNGDAGGEAIPCEDLADWAGMILHKVLTNIGPRVPRLYVNAPRGERPARAL